MIELLLGIYALILWLIFKKFKLLPINLWTVVTSIFILIAALSFGMIFLTRYQPVTRFARTYIVTTPIIAEVSGRVIEVTAEGGKPLQKGDILFKIDPEPYQARYDSLDAQLKLADIKLKQELGLKADNAGNQNDLDKAQSDVDRLTADLRAAKYQLEATTVRAPSDGYASQVTIRPGQVVMPMAFAQVMVFVPTSNPLLAAGFTQTQIEFIDAGDQAEVAFDALPGKVFQAKVRGIQPLLAEGAVSASGQLRTLNDAGRRGLIPVAITLESDLSAYNLPAGSNAMVAVYTGEKSHLDLVRMIILRIKSWENWLPF
ncbi:MAG: HlyD family secretion protein [Tepidisphaera sp.]|jgi:multidrug resistance efflux pump